MSRITFFVVGLIILVVMAFNSFFIVNQVEQALVLQFGKAVRVEQSPGLKFKMPFIQNVLFFDKRLLDFNAEPKEVIDSEKQPIIIDAFLRYRITDPLQYYQAVQNERGVRSRLDDILESSLREVVGSYPYTVLLTPERINIMNAILKDVSEQASGTISKEAQRVFTEAMSETDAEAVLEANEEGEVSATVLTETDEDQSATAELMEEQVTETVRETEEPVATQRNDGFGIEIVDVRIKRADLSERISEDVYNRMRSEREQIAKELRAQGEEKAQIIRSTADRERAELLAEARKKSEIIRGEGDAVATKTYAEAYSRDEEFYDFYRTIQAYRETLKGKDTTMILTPDSEFLKYLERMEQ